MKKRKIFGLIFLILGFFLILNSFSSITGFVVIEEISSRAFGLLGLIFIIVGILMIGWSEGLERRVILPKKHFKDLTPKERAFRRKLVNLFEKPMQKPILPRKIAYLLPQYDKVIDTGEFVKGYNIYLGRRGNREEYFSVDTKELIKFELGGETFFLPTHTDIQKRLDKNEYKKIKKENIPWDELFKYSDDILDYFRRRKKKSI